MLLPGTDQAGALQVARNLHGAVDALALLHPISPSNRVSVSIGGATSHTDAPAPSLALVRAADGALYQAKILGRGRTEWGVPRGGGTAAGSASGARRAAEPA